MYARDTVYAVSLLRGFQNEPPCACKRCGWIGGSRKRLIENKRLVTRGAIEGGKHMAENKRDYYEVLGVSKTASDDDIKKAYRKLAKEYHPDLHPGDQVAETKFKELNEAYEVLSDPQKKSKYDQFGFAGVDPTYGAGQPGYGGGYGAYGSGFGGFDVGDFGDIFSSIFGGGFGGGGQSRNAPRRGEDVERSVQISFEEAAFGCAKDITVNRVEKCSECDGSGAAKGSAVETCNVCHGSGQVRTTRRTALGTVSTTGVCQACGGKGKTIKNPCSACRGAGQIRRSRTISVKIPAGIDDDQTVVLRGQGHQGANGGPNGDLLINVRVGRHEFFTRDGSNLLCTVPITFTQAALGDTIEVPGLEGTFQYTIPEGVQSGTVFRIKNRGIAQVNTKNRGDYLLTVVVETPRGLNSKQKELLRNFESTLQDKNSAQKKSFLDKVREKFNK